MTYAEALTLRAALESAQLSGAGVVSVQIGDRQVQYSNGTEARRVLNLLNRDIAAYENRRRGRNPHVSRATWTR